MDPYYLHSLPGSQASEDACTQAAQCMEQHSRLYSLQGAPSQHLPTGFGQQYSLPTHGCHGSSPTYQMPRQNSGPSFPPPAESRFSRATSSISNHGYYHADRVSVPHQEWVQQPYAAISAPISASGAVMWPYDVVIGNCASARRQNPSQSSPAANKFTADPPFDPALQVKAPVPNPDENIPSSAGSFARRQNPSQSSPASNRFAADPPFDPALQLNVPVPVPDINENVPSSMGSFSVPGQTLPATHRRPVSPPFPPIDPQDIEYAQYRYGKKRCFYRCHFDVSGSPCNKWIVGDRTRVLRHLRSHHHLQTGPATPAVCRWERCTHSRPMKHENLSRHVVMHLGVKWKCPHCSRLFSRDDAVHRHMERMAPGMEVSEAEVMPGRDARAITDSQFKRARAA